MRSNHVAVIGREEESCLTLAGEDREMVLPEVDDGLLQLTFARYRARELGRLDVAHDALGSPRALAQLRVIPKRLPPRPLPRHRVAGCASEHLLAAPSLLHLSEYLDEVGGARIERLVMRDELVRRPVVDLLWRELQRDPVVHAKGTHTVHVARPRAESQPIEGLVDLLIRKKLAQLARPRRRHS